MNSAKYNSNVKNLINRTAQLPVTTAACDSVSIKE